MNGGETRARSSTAPVALALAALALFAWRFDFLVDDAFISFRYGWHLAHGNGLVFNAGEDPPVEGFSNFLWVVVCAALELARLDPVLWTRLVSAACGAALVILVASVVRRRVTADRAVVGGAALFLASLPPVGVWCTGGMETMPFALAVFATFERLCGRRDRPRGAHAGLCAALAVLLRADGFVWVAIALAAASGDASCARRAGLWRAIASTAACAAAAALAYLAFRWSYFGELEPNTARAKVHLGALSLERGALYVASACLAIPSIPLALGAGAVAALRARGGLAVPSLAAFAAASAYLVLIGGDWMMAYRMLVPALPFAALALACALAGLGPPLARIALASVAVGLSVLAAFDVHVVPRGVRELAHFRWGQEYRTEHAVWAKGVTDIEEWMELGRAVGRFVKPGESIVLGNIGAIGYYAPELEIHDTHGLTNREPFLPVDPTARAMPGHDRKVAVDAFEKYAPTYFATTLVDAADPYARLPKKWLEPGSDAARKFELIVLPLDPALGFRPGKALLFAKYRR